MPSQAQILIVDAEESAREHTCDILAGEGFTVTHKCSLTDARSVAGNGEFDLLIADLGAFDGTDPSRSPFLKQHFSGRNVVITVENTNASALLQLDHTGIGALLIKPFTREQLLSVVEEALGESESKPHTTAADHVVENDLGLVGSSSFMRELREAIRRIAVGDFPVLVQGDSGTGKEVVAHAIHQCSNRRDHDMVVVNCGAIPKHLEESEFFGHTRGAFTGAYTTKRGVVAEADNSTLFLDEIGETSLEVQAMLLRVLDKGEFTPIGKNMPENVNIRIVSATNRDLEQMVKEGTFREDLYFRLKGVVLSTLRLTRHRDDIEPLVRHFLAEVENPDMPRTVTREALDLLVSYDWPGNIRELKYTVEVLSVAAVGKEEIDVETVRSMLSINEPPEPQVQMSYNEAKAKVLEEFERDYFGTLIRQHDGNVSQASKAAGMHRPNLVNKLKRLGISPADYRK